MNEKNLQIKIKHLTQQLEELKEKMKECNARLSNLEIDKTEVKQDTQTNNIFKRIL